MQLPSFLRRLLLALLLLTPALTQAQVAGQTPPGMAFWVGRLLDARSRLPLPAATVTLTNPPAELAGPATMTGAFSYLLPVGVRFTYETRMAGYAPTTGSFTLTDEGLQQDLRLAPLQLGLTLKLDNVQFERGKSEVLPGSLPALNQLAQLMQQYPRLEIELRGHTDNTGDEQDPRPNVKLSEDRVAAVKAYLVGQGIAESRIRGKGFGGSQPLASNAREETRQLNRRVEFTITKLE